jgi:PAS domain S-box-containing protein
MRMPLHEVKSEDWSKVSHDLLEEGKNIKISSSLKVKDFMRTNPWILTEEDTLQSAGDIIINKKIDGVPIVNVDGTLSGLVTKTQLLREILQGTDLNTPVKNCMLTDVFTIDPDDDVSALIRVSIGNLPVVRGGNVQGIVTLSDTVRAYFSSLMAIREELDTIIDSTHNGIITINENGIIILVNRATEDFFKTPRYQIIGQHIAKFLPAGDLIEVLDTGREMLGEKVVFKDKVFISNHSPVISNNQIIGAVAVFQDISDLEQISEELEYTKRMKEELDAIIESSFDAIYITDGEGITLRVNEAYSRMSGIPREAFLGKTLEELVDEGSMRHSTVPLVLKRKERVTTLCEKNGHKLLKTGSPIFDNSGRISRVVMNIRDITELDQLKTDLEQARNLSQHYQEELTKYNMVDKYIIRSPKSRDLLDLCIRLGRVDTTVLIQGESGVGKEIAANIIHSNSARGKKPLISINCAAIPENLLESELFGYSPGAFTGANKHGKAGIFETANAGTLFLDEVAELPLTLQGKLLRAIQQREITRVGSTEPTSIDVRIIAATNRDLEQMVALKKFRKDLYYRLNVVPVTVPPLRERKVEIPFLVNHFLEIFNSKYGLNKRIDERVIKNLMNYNWPGNVRELENLIERLVVTSPTDIIKKVDLP